MFLAVPLFLNEEMCKLTESVKCLQPRQATLVSKGILIETLLFIAIHCEFAGAAAT